jgi:flagellar export protein FliJ
MSFEFSLSAVLRYRQSIEQREHFALERIGQEVAGVELRIRNIEQDCSVATQSRARELTQGIRAGDMQLSYEYQNALEQQGEALRAALRELKVKWRRQLVCYQGALRNRDTLDKLREKQLEAYRRELAKREQAVIDDLFLSRHGRK